VVAVVTLALGIGANTAMFSAVDTVLIKGLPYPDADRVVMVWEDASAFGLPRSRPAPGNYTDWTQLARSFTGLAATRGASANLTEDGPPEQLLGNRVSASFFHVLGVEPMIGHSFTEEDDRTGAAVVIISADLWRRRFGEDPRILGRTIRLSDNPYEVIGVMPRPFVFRTRDVDYWIPIHLSPAQATDRGSHNLEVVGRLSAGVSLGSAQQEMTHVAEILQQRYPATNGQVGIRLVRVAEDVVGNAKLEFLVLMGAAGAVLLIACTNLASLLLSRAAGRRSELAVRAMLGAGRAELVRQMVLEGLVLSLAGGLAGLALAPALITLVAQFAPGGFPALPSSVLSMPLLTFTLSVSIAAGVIFSLAPALQAVDRSLFGALQEGGRSTIGGRARVTRDVLVVTEVAAALVLLVAAGLMLRTMANLHAIDVGFRSDHLLTLRTSLPTSRYATVAKRLTFYNAVLDAVRPLPGVDSAAYGSVLPFVRPGDTITFQIDGRTLDANDPGDALFRAGTPQYLHTIGARLLTGRLLDERDGRLEADAPLSVVINETMARRYWSNSTPLGRQLRFGSPAAPLYTIVGVVQDLRERGYELAMKPAVYLPYVRDVWAVPEYLIVRTRTNPATLAEPTRRAIAAIDPDQPVTALHTMDEVIDLGVFDRTEQTRLLSLFSALALLVASLGLYGVLSYSVTQRRRELGLRMALGASSGSVMGRVITRGLCLTAVGLGLGITVAWAGARAMSTLLYGVASGDPATFAAVCALLFTVALVASYLPARRAARTDPMIALRDQ
jgi:predicted permease